MQVDAVMRQADYIVVGSGLTGSTIARHLADAGRDVLILDRREHGGGNVFDHVHDSGIRVHNYGPHFFRTASEKIQTFVERFADFYGFAGVVQTWVDGQLEAWPVNESYLRRTHGEDWRPAFVGVPSNFEDKCRAMMPQAVYEKFIKGYTEKQWGMAASALPVSLAGRFDVRSDDDPRLKTHSFQGLPHGGYAELMSSMIKSIPLELGVDFLNRRDDFRARRQLIFTGPIDEFFGFKFGKLGYRSQRRETTYHHDAEFLQPCSQVNFPDPAAGPHVRTIEWKHMMPSDQVVRGSVITRETPFTPSDPDRYEYPCVDDANRRLYSRYAELAQSTPGITMCGRLAEYRYLDMDQAIARAMRVARRLLAT